MARSPYVYLFAFLLGWLVIPGSSFAQNVQPIEPKTYALLVAVEEYSHALLNKPQPLKYPEDDALAIKAALKQGGYEVDTLLGREATRDAIREKLEGLRFKGDSQGAVVLGFFGHGVEFKGNPEAMFCPYDAKMRKAKDACGNQLDADEPDPETLIGMKMILEELSISPAKNKLILADCCRRSPNSARGPGFGEQFEKDALPNNTVALFACEAGQEAQEDGKWGGGHGAMTFAFLKLLPELYEDENENDVMAITGKMHSLIKEIVKEATGGKKDQTLQPFSNGIVKLRLRHPVATPSLRANSINLELVRIPNGRKDMDYDYYLAKHEVTQGQYELVMGTNPSKNQHGKNLPVEQVSFLDAKEFCRKLTELEIKDGKLPPGMVYRLPWKREWEVAHSKNIDQLSPNELQKVGWFGNKNGDRTTRRIGNSNDLEIHDLFGNVAEWCLDQELDDVTKDPMHLAVGGSFFITPETFLKQPKERNVPGEWLNPDAKRYDVGFRVVLVPANSAQQSK